MNDVSLLRILFVYIYITCGGMVGSYAMGLCKLCCLEMLITDDHLRAAEGSLRRMLLRVAEERYVG